MNTVEGYIWPSSNLRKPYQYMLLYEFPQMSSDRCTIYFRIAVWAANVNIFTVRIFLYSTIKFTKRLNGVNKPAKWWLFIFTKMNLLPHHIVQNNAVVNVFPEPYQSKRSNWQQDFSIYNL